MDLVSLAAPADAPDGAPLLFSKNSPGHCRWGEEVVATVTGTDPRLAQVIALANQHERDLNTMRQRCEELERLIRLLDGRLESASLTIREVA